MPVIGAGVVGLTIGRALAMRGIETIVLERANAIGNGTSSRNSEVIHAGIYYPSGSLKARRCGAWRAASSCTVAANRMVSHIDAAANCWWPRANRSAPSSR